MLFPLRKCKEETQPEIQSKAVGGCYAEAPALPIRFARHRSRIILSPLLLRFPQICSQVMRLIALDNFD